MMDKSANIGINSFSTQKGLITGFVIIINTYSWFFPLYIFFEDLLHNILQNDTLIIEILGIHYLVALVSAFVGVFLASKFEKRDELLILWMLIGTITSLSLIGLSNINHPYLYFTSFLLGISLGLGFPSCLAYFSDYNTENKGKHAGITFLVCGIGILMVGFFTALLPFYASVIMFTLWRGIGCLFFLIKRPKSRKLQERFEISYRSLLEEKAFMLYWIPWIMYCLINFLEASLLKNFFGHEFSYFVPIAEFGIGGVIALIGGCLSDVIGRKPIIAFGYVALGLGYSFLGLFSNNIFSWYAYIIVDGISLGIFALAFFLLLWGELAANKYKEKYYLLGNIPYLILSYLGIIAGPYIQSIPVSSAFSLAAFFLFLAIIPLMYAPETLPEKTLRERELRQYVEKAKKVREKFT